MNEPKHQMWIFQKGDSSIVFDLSPDIMAVWVLVKGFDAFKFLEGFRLNVSDLHPNTRSGLFSINDQKSRNESRNLWRACCEHFGYPPKEICPSKYFSRGQVVEV
jgi:hypothetical protein